MVVLKVSWCGIDARGARRRRPDRERRVRCRAVAEGVRELDEAVGLVV